MAALSERHRAFVRAVLDLAERGVQSFGRAARMAGYSQHKGTSKTTGLALSHDPRIQAALLEESRKKQTLGAVIATSIVVKFAMNEKLDVNHRLKACQMLLNRGGLPEITEHKVTVEHKQPAKMIDLATQLAKELGLEPQRLLGINRDGEAIDAEYTEVHGATKTDKAVNGAEPERKTVDGEQVT